MPPDEPQLPTVFLVEDDPGERDALPQIRIKNDEVPRWP